MSTRANVHVTATGLVEGDTETIQLYHHCDGYPTNMLPLMASHKGNGWQAGRAGKLAAYLIATDPGGFEPEPELGLHPDIEYFYCVTTHNKNGGATSEIPRIEVEIYVPSDGFWDAPNLEHMRKLAGPILLATAARQAKKIEGAAD